MKFGISNLYFINLLFKNYIFFINIYKKYFNILNMKILLSYPRSGNHLMRFFIEILTENPTLGCIDNNLDKPIFMNIFPKEVKFNISSLDNYNELDLYIKYHYPPINNIDNLIFIVRNPKEVLLRHSDYKYDINNYNSYFDLIDYYNKYDGNKNIFFYEDMCSHKNNFIKELYEFLDNKNEKKLEYVLENIDELFELSKEGKNRNWGGVNSNSIDNYYYSKISGIDKENFDNYIKSKIETNKYNIIKEKYNL
jgi:hypothetical protein